MIEIIVPEPAIVVNHGAGVTAPMRNVKLGCPKPASSDPHGRIERDDFYFDNCGIWDAYDTLVSVELSNRQ